MDTLLLVSCRQKRLTRRLQDQTTSVPQRDTAPLCQKRHTRKAAKKMERHETACQEAFCQSVAHHCMCPPPVRRLCAHLLGNLPWCRPVGPSWPLEADRKVTPHGQLLARRKYGYGLKAKTSIIQPNVHFVTFIIAHSSMARKNAWHAVTRLRRSQKRHSRLLSPTVRMIKPVCQVATEILEVLASGALSSTN